jgi:hypothetical protein
MEHRRPDPDWDVILTVVSGSARPQVTGVALGSPVADAAS